MTGRWIAIAAVCLAASLLAGCVTTRPWQRERLADPMMSPDGDGDRESLRNHMLGTREGAPGGFGRGGGGCGCN